MERRNGSDARRATTSSGGSGECSGCSECPTYSHAFPSLPHRHRIAVIIPCRRVGDTFHREWDGVTCLLDDPLGSEPSSDNPCGTVCPTAALHCCLPLPHSGTARRANARSRNIAREWEKVERGTPVEGERRRRGRRRSETHHRTRGTTWARSDGGDAAKILWYLRCLLLRERRRRSSPHLRGCGHGGPCDRQE